MMESGRLFFDPSSCNGNMLFLGGGDSIFRGPRTMLSMEENSKRRPPFFSSPDDLFDEEYYDEQSPEKKRRLTSEQVHLLEKSFETENKLEPERKTELAKKLGLQPRQVAVWFQNRRARWKTKQLERDYDVLKASYDSLLSNYETVVKDNERLKSEVVTLTERLQANEFAISGRQTDVGAMETPDLSVRQSNGKIEDRLSSVVDEEGPQLVDSCESYFPGDYAACEIRTRGIPTEEDDGSDEGRSYFSDVFATTEQQLEDGEPIGWWVWS